MRFEAWKAKGHAATSRHSTCWSGRTVATSSPRTGEAAARRPPRDRMNALLSFLYAMWMNDCRSACEAAGLDPQVGYLQGP